MKCTSPFRKVIDDVVRELPCGQCMACRLNHARMWSIRISHEASCHAHNVFLTLTYDDEHLPADGSVHKRDLQLFFKRLRKELKGAKLRYFCCGEYGDKFGRPHYHCVIFGLGMESKVFKNKRFDAKTNGYHCQMDSWPCGLCHIGTVTVDSANYVAGYVTKKLKGKGAKEHYANLGIQPEFVLMSRRPGIGADFFYRQKKQMENLGFVWCKDKKYALPRFYQERISEDVRLEKKLNRRIELDIEGFAKAKAQGITYSQFRRFQDEQLERNITAFRKVRKR